MAIGLDLDSFAAQTLGGTYGTPPPVMERNKGTFKGQCASYCRQYCEAVLAIKSEVWGNAVDWWTNPKVLALFDRIPKGKERDGDIAVWGDDPGSFTGKEGHDGIWYKGRILNQNYNGSLKVSINDFFPQGYLGALRLKGDTMLDGEGAKEVYRATLHREPENDQVWRPLVGQNAGEVLKRFREGEEWKVQNDKIANYGALNHNYVMALERIKELEAQESSEYEEVTVYRRIK